MTDDLSQATAQPIPDAVQAEAVPGEASPQGQPQTEKPITMDDLRRIVREETMPLIQSQVSKGENRVEKRIAERFAALEANAGVLKLDEAQVKAAKYAIINEEQMNAYAPNPQASGQGQPTAPVQTADEGARQVQAQLQMTWDEIGTAVTPQDKEWQTVQDALNDPQGGWAKLIIAAQKAAMAKAQRVQAQQQRAPARVVTPGTGGGTQTKPTMTAKEKISAGLQKANWSAESPKRN